MVAIVVAGYNRTQPLSRLLNCLDKAEYGNDKNINLIISLDRADICLEMKKIADDFIWRFGDKKVILHEKRLGLREHFLFCGDLTQEYGSVIFLEDDIYILPSFYRFAIESIEKYENDDRIVGGSLYSLRYNETAHRPFIPLNDGTDVYFAQLMSWAPIYFPRQWKAFRDWYDKADKPMIDVACLPDNVRQWKPTSFKKFHIKYTAENNKFFVYPQVSYTTNFAEAGLHYKADSDNLQVPLIMHEISNLRLPSFDESLSIYDVFLEIKQDVLKRLNSSLSKYDFDVDLYGNKRKANILAPYCLTNRNSKKIIKSYGRKTVPHETNILLDVPGNSFILARTEDVEFKGRGIRTAYSDILYDVKGSTVLKAIATDVRVAIQEFKSRS